MATKADTYGFSLPMVLFLIFLVLKLCKVITWSWWWVTSPLWIAVAITFLAILVTVVYITLKEK